MTTIKIDNKDYDYATLPAEAKTQLANLQFIEAEQVRLNAKIAVLQTARNSYAKALSDALATITQETITLQ